VSPFFTSARTASEIKPSKAASQSPIARTDHRPSMIRSVVDSRQWRCLFVARPVGPVWRCPLIGVDRKGPAHGQSDAIDPQRTLRLQFRANVPRPSPYRASFEWASDRVVFPSSCSSERDVPTSPLQPNAQRRCSRQTPHFPKTDNPFVPVSH
jgi:hypothetical protein